MADGSYFLKLFNCHAPVIVQDGLEQAFRKST